MIEAHDKDWQFPAITEQHAFIKAKVHLDSFEQAVYVGFPWATLIDLLVNQKQESEQLLESLVVLGKKLSGYAHKVTVCQHIAAKRFAYLFQSIGITHLYWSHAVKNESYFPEYPLIEVLPFPLYAVHVIRGTVESAPQKQLVSFVGAKSNQWYLSDVRNLIIEHLSADQRTLIIERGKWHFNKIVYDHQIHQAVEFSKDLEDATAELEFKRIMGSSIFSLCPSGTGPNSIRLWESLGSGVIPVILADNYLPPGNKELWDEACIFCGENLQEITQLVDHLQVVYGNKELVERKLAACKQLWSLYGREFFIPDVFAKFLELEQAGRLYCQPEKQLNTGIVANLLTNVLMGRVLTANEKRFCILSFVSNVLLDPVSSLEFLRINAKFIAALKTLLRECDETTRKHAQKVFQAKLSTVLLDIEC